jgi:hypothetical protein
MCRLGSAKQRLVESFEFIGPNTRSAEGVRFPEEFIRSLFAKWFEGVIGIEKLCSLIGFGDHTV